MKICICPFSKPYLCLLGTYCLFPQQLTTTPSYNSVFRLMTSLLSLFVYLRFPIFNTCFSAQGLIINVVVVRNKSLDVTVISSSPSKSSTVWHICWILNSFQPERLLHKAKNFSKKEMPRCLGPFMLLSISA